MLKEQRTSTSCKTMKETTQVYLEQDGKYLMLYRNKKEIDMNAGKWIAAGGKSEPGETPDSCARREVLEETGFACTKLEYRGEVFFENDIFENEIMHIFTCSDFEKAAEPVDDEGTFAWIEKERIMELDMWEGDRLFMPFVLGKAGFFRMRLIYSGYDLKEAYLDGKRI